MTETSARIRWEDIASSIDALASRGFVGELERRSFIIYKPEFDGGQYRLLCLIGDRGGDSLYAGDPDELKDEAERWLAGFVASLGAVFPAEPDDDLFSDDEGGEPLEVKYASGRRVRYIHPDAGYPGEKEDAAASLTLGGVYTIGWADIGQSKTDLNLYRDRKPLGRFNSVFFEPADDETTAATAGERRSGDEHI